MNCNIKNNTVLVITGNTITEYALDNLDSLNLSYDTANGIVAVDQTLSKHEEFDTRKTVQTPAINRTIVAPLTYQMLINNGWTVDQIMMSEYAHLLPQPASTPKAPEKVGKRGRVNNVNRKREFAGRRPHKKDQGTMKRQDICAVADAYILYVDGGAAETLIKSLDAVKLSTFYSWCSTITRLLASKNVPGKLIKLRQIARLVSDKQR